MHPYPKPIKPRGHPEISFLGFDLEKLLAEVRRGFPELDARNIEVWLQRQATLACIDAQSATAKITLHAVLNHRDTPRGVVARILGHELIHLMIPPREVDGKMTGHPPEFWEAEKRLFPDMHRAWIWLFIVLGQCIKCDRKRECTTVKPNWKKHMDYDRIGIERAVEIVRIEPAKAGDCERLIL